MQVQPVARRDGYRNELYKTGVHRRRLKPTYAQTMVGLAPIECPHVMTAPDEPVLLYEGDGTVSDISGSEASGTLSVFLEWVPTPRVVFHLEADSNALPPWTSSVVVRTTEPRELEGMVGTYSVSGSSDEGVRTTIEGVCWGEYRPSREGLAYVVFSIANLPDMVGTALEVTHENSTRMWKGRNVYEGAHWKLTIDRLNLSESTTARWLSGAGFGITNVAKLERKDGCSTSVEEVEKTLPAVSQFLGFVRGEPAPVLLPRGIGIGGDVVWEKWSSPITTPWRASSSAFPNHVRADNAVRPPRLEPVFGFFTDRWTDDEWAELLRFGVGWYLTANTVPGVETQIVLAQAGLELASWNVFVPDRMSKDGFQRLPAHDNLRLLLSEASISTDISASALTTLKDYAKANTWEDGPRAITELRNLLVHPTKRLRAHEVPSEVMIEASRLAMSYLQSVLLFILQYNDEYLPALGLSRQEDTPWRKPLSISPVPESPRFPPLARP